jgi:hypothetical protein
MWSEHRPQHKLPGKQEEQKAVQCEARQSLLQSKSELQIVAVVKPGSCYGLFIIQTEIG